MTREELEEHALEHALSNFDWWKDKGAIYDDGTNEFIPLSQQELKVIHLALVQTAESISLNTPLKYKGE